MNGKDKGARRERQARDILLAQGHLVTKAGGSLGAFDLVALPSAARHGYECRLMAPLVQVKSNKWAGPKERAAMEAKMQKMARIIMPVAEIWRFDDHKGLRILRLTDDGWVSLLPCGSAERVVFEVQP